MLYQPFLENLANTVALTLEIRNHENTLKQVNEELFRSKDELEILVQERTKELTLRNEELQRWGNIFENAEWGVTVGTADGTTFEMMNPAFAKMHGYTIDELKGKSLLNVFPPEVRDELQINVKLAHEKGHHIWESVHLHKDGRRFPVLIDITTVSNERGETLYHVVNVQDITERKQAETILRESQLRFSTVFQSSPIGIGISTLDGKFTDVNPALCKLFGYTRDELIGHTTLELNIWSQPKQRERMLEELRGKESAHDLEVLLRRKTGETMDLIMEVDLIDLDGEQHILASLLNITERKQAENIIKARLELIEFSRNHSLDELLVKTLDKVCAMVNSPVGFYHFVEPDQKTLSLQAWSTRTMQEYCNADGRGRHYPVDQAGVWADCIREKRAVIHNDYASLPNRKGLAEGHAVLSRELVVPILREGLIVAILGVGNKVQEYNEKDVEFVTYFADLAWEIIKRKRAEEELRTLTLRNEEALQAAQMGHWEFDLETGLFTFNDQYYTLHGMTAAQAGGYQMSAQEFASKYVHPDDAHLVGESFQQAMNVTDSDFHPFAEGRILRADGKPRYVSIWFRSEKDSQGRTVKLYGVNQDITERKQAENALLASELRERERATELQTIMDTVPAIVSIAHDNKCQVVTGNQALYDLLNLPPKSNTSLTAPLDQYDAHYKIFIDSVPPPPNELPLQTSASAGIEIRDLEEKLVFDDGKIVHLLGNVVPLYDDQEQSRGAVAAFVDITDRKLADERLQIQLERLRSLHNIDSAINSSNKLSATLKIFLEEVTSQLKVDAASILLLNQDTLTLEYAASLGFNSNVLKHSRLGPGEGYAGRVVLEGKTIHISDLHKTKSQLSEVMFRTGEDFVDYFGIPLFTKGQIVGVLEIFHHSHLTPDPEWFDFLETLTSQAAIAIDNARLFENLQRFNFELTVAYDATIEGWSRILDLRDKETEGHTQRVANLTVELAQQMDIPSNDLPHIRRGALLHDIGKMGIPDSILLKPSKLTPEEWDSMQQHTVYAYEMLQPIKYLRPALDIPRYHHEKWDGTGYPDKLKGNNIPFSARIFAIVDVWDAITSDRPYRTAWSRDKALEYIKSESGKQFDPAVVDVFLTMISNKPEQTG